MKKITYNDLDRWNTCCRKDGEEYSNDVLAKRGWGPEGIIPLELSLQRWIPVEDRIWGLLHKDVLGDELQPVLDEIVNGVVREYCLHCGVPEVESWAEKWLSGEDRTARSAWSAAWSAGGPEAMRKERYRQLRIIRKALKRLEE